MSLTASAATAVLTALADKPDGGGERRWEDQLKEQRDLYTQFVISSALGLGAFLTFCVSVHNAGCENWLSGSSLTGCVSIDLTTKMDRAVRCPTTTAECRFAFT